MNPTEQKVKETIVALKEWLDHPSSKEDYTTYGIDKIRGKLNELKIPKSIINGFESLDNWYSNNFVYELLTKNTTTYRELVSANGLHNVLIANGFADKYVNNPPDMSFDKSTYWLANCLIQKWYNESESVLKIIDKWLNNDCLEGGLAYRTSSWFIITIANQGYGFNIDYSKYNYPKDIGVYQNALNNWNTTDLVFLDNIVSSLCEFHLNEASHGDLSDNAGKKDPIFLQFSSTKWFVYTFEILAWLSIREKTGLRNPEKFSHPLMNLELNKLSENITSVPENELFNLVMARLKLESSFL